MLKMMPTSPKAQLKSMARVATAPARDYVNNHFEMTKAEVRGLIDRIGELDRADQDGSVLDLANVIAETALFQSQMLNNARDEMIATRSEIDELRSDVKRLSDLTERLIGVVGAMNSTPAHPDGPTTAAES